MNRLIPSLSALALALSHSAAFAGTVEDMRARTPAGRRRGRNGAVSAGMAAYWLRMSAL